MSVPGTDAPPCGERDEAGVGATAALAEDLFDGMDIVECYCGYFWRRGDREDHRSGCPEASS